MPTALSVRRFSDYAGADDSIREYRGFRVAFLPYRNGVGVLIQTGFSKLNSPAHRYLYLGLKRDLAISPARLEARMESLPPFL